MSLLVFIPLAPCALRKPYFMSNHLYYHNLFSAHLLISVSVLQVPNIRMVEVLGQILGQALSATEEAEVAASEEAAHAVQCLQICHGEREMATSRQELLQNWSKNSMSHLCEGQN